MGLGMRLYFIHNLKHNYLLQGIYVIMYCLKEVTTSLWTCKSQSETSNNKINVLESSCKNESCQLKCRFMDCNSLCRHMYACECVDYANGYICKHLHGVHRLKLKSHTAKSNDDTLSDTIGIHTFLCTLSGYTLLYDTDFMEIDENAGLMEVDERAVLPSSIPVAQGILISNSMY